MIASVCLRSPWTRAHRLHENTFKARENITPRQIDLICACR